MLATIEPLATNARDGFELWSGDEGGVPVEMPVVIPEVGQFN
jgi:hypothetical protein